MTISSGLTIDMFKLIMGTLMTLTIAAFTFQQTQIARLDGKIEGFKESVSPSLASINVSLAGMSKDIDWIKKALGEAEIIK